MGHARFETTKAYIDEYDAEELALALRPGSAQEVPKGKSRVEKLLETAGVLVGDTGFEPTGSVEKQRDSGDSSSPKGAQKGSAEPE